MPELILQNPLLISYPSNYPIRKYQQEIVLKSLFSNTLISLPTGMGKTLIASVVLYNYYLWFNNGKVLFLAPTKPLIIQQMIACLKILNFNSNDCVLFDSSCSINEREKLWNEKRIFFCTPQVII